MDPAQKVLVLLGLLSNLGSHYTSLFASSYLPLSLKNKSFEALSSFELHDIHANDLDWMSSLGKKNLQLAADELKKLVLFLRKNNSQVAKEFIKIVFHIILSMPVSCWPSPLILSLVATIKYMSLSSSFRTEDSLQLHDCLNQWFSLNKNDSNFISSRNGEKNKEMKNKIPSSSSFNSFDGYSSSSTISSQTISHSSSILSTLSTTQTTPTSSTTSNLSSSSPSSPCFSNSSASKISSATPLNSFPSSVNEINIDFYDNIITSLLNQNTQTLQSQESSSNSVIVTKVTEILNNHSPASSSQCAGHSSKPSTFFSKNILINEKETREKKQTNEVFSPITFSSSLSLAPPSLFFSSSSSSYSFSTSSTSPSSFSSFPSSSLSSSRTDKHPLLGRTYSLYTSSPFTYSLSAPSSSPSSFSSSPPNNFKLPKKNLRNVSSLNTITIATTSSLTTSPNNIPTITTPVPMKTLLTEISSHAPLSPQSSGASSGSNHSEGNHNIQDSETIDISQWLKSLRLHKYSPIFKGLTFGQLTNLSENWLEQQGVTKGARNKILLNINKFPQRPALLREIEKKILQGQNLKQCVNDLKPVVFAPISPNSDVFSDKISTDSITSTNNTNTINTYRSTKTGDNFEKQTFQKNYKETNNSTSDHLQTTSVSSTSPENTNKLTNVPRNQRLLDWQLSNSNSSTEEEFSDSLTHLITRVLGKLTSQLLVTSTIEPATLTSYHQLINRCILHHAFNESQIKKLNFFKNQVTSLSSSHFGGKRNHFEKYKLSYSQSLAPNTNIKLSLGPRHSNPLQNKNHNNNINNNKNLLLNHSISNITNHTKNFNNLQQHKQQQQQHKLLESSNSTYDRSFLTNQELLEIITLQQQKQYFEQQQLQQKLQQQIQQQQQQQHPSLNSSLQFNLIDKCHQYLSLSNENYNNNNNNNNNLRLTSNDPITLNNSNSHFLLPSSTSFKCPLGRTQSAPNSSLPPLQFSQVQDSSSINSESLVANSRITDHPPLDTESSPGLRTQAKRPTTTLPSNPSKSTVKRKQEQQTPGNPTVSTPDDLHTNLENLCRNMMEHVIGSPPE